MSWDPIWESVFRSRDWGKYPPEELIRFVARNYYTKTARHKVRFLELGCGEGANVWYLAREGFAAYGIDGSVTAIGKAQDRLTREGLEAHLKVGDILEISQAYPAGSFDAIIDIACLQCNRLGAVEKTISSARSLLRSGGKFFAIMVARNSYGDGLGIEIESGTFIDAVEGPFRDIGLSHLFTIEEIRSLFREFGQINIEYSIRSLNQQTKMYKNWIVEATL